jgi:cytochrome c-type biogenesis protein CcsB
MLLGIFITTSVTGQQGYNLHEKLDKIKVDSILHQRAFPKEEAAKFGYLLIQDYGGRFKPANTYASELLRKVSKRDMYEGLDANQVLLSMIQNPRLWFDVPLIKLKRGNDSIRKVLEIPLDTKYAALADFYTPEGKPKIPNEQVREANMTANPNAFQKDIKRAYEDQRLLSQALSGSLIRIFPVPGDDNNKWVSALEIRDLDYGPDNQVIKNLFPTAYFEFMIKKDYKTATGILDGIKKVQKGYSEQVMPSDDKIKTEVLYNKYDVFKKLFSWYMYAGGLMFIFLILYIFNEKKWISFTIKLCKIAIIVLFFVHLGGLVARWYVSGHAPWSDAYESMIYVAFATMLYGLLFGRKSDLTIASTAFVASMILMIAHWNSIDPSIANLQPVLDSYWLMIHVAVIVGSYGPFALGMILGVVALILMLFTTKENKAKMKFNLDEITVISEMAITIGLIMLTIGNFLGGQWANESWGRYWGWDPKETWALISIMVYAFVLHMRFIPGLRNKWFFNLMSIIAFASILMTYFGVNFYLVGLHSYASGESAVTPNFIYYASAIIILLGTASWVKYKKYYKK